ncbi:hypothetical protein LP419_28205 [Massilia sp. H-1]|nr:hypothetical protein LP419_28205 [Massilia sp. H-1]
MNFSHEKQTGKNFTGIAAVILIHALVIWGLVSGLGTRMVTKMAEAVETKIIEEVKPPPPKEVPPPPPPPEMKAPPPPFIPPVEVNVQQPPPPVSPIQNMTTQAPASKELQKLSTGSNGTRSCQPGSAARCSSGRLQYLRKTGVSKSFAA